MTDTTQAISNTDDLIDIRDVIARIEYLRDSWTEATGDDPDDYAALSEDDWRAGLDGGEAHELVALVELLDECKGNGGDHQHQGDWYPVTLIRDTYFEDYARELAEDIGAVPAEYTWPTSCIDWEQAARDLRMDYTSVDFDGVDYWTRR